MTETAGAFGALGLAALLVSASALMGAIRGALNVAWNVRDKRSLLRGKLVDALLVLGVGLVVTFSVALTLISRAAVYVGGELSGALGPLASGLPQLLLVLGQLVPVLVSFTVFAFLYRAVPAADVRLRDVWPGALIAAVGFELAKTGFSFYLENLADYGAVYGSLSAVVAFLVFVFVAANVMVLGAEAASEWPAVREGARDAREASPPR